MTSWRVDLDRHLPAVASYPGGATFGPRRLDSFELVWLISGEAEWIRHDESTVLRLRPGSLLLARPGMHDEIHWLEPSRHGYIHFQLRGQPDVAQWPLTRAIVAPGPFGGLLDYLLWLGAWRPQGWKERIEDALGLVLRAFVWGPLPGERLPAEPPVLAAALDHVARQWHYGIRPVSLPELAEAAAVSKAHLARLFRRQFGVGVVEGLELVRLARAEILLTRSNLSITEVARECGFPDPLYFSRRFRKAFGVGPRAYRGAGEGPSPLTARGLLGLAQRLSQPQPWT